MNEFNVLKIAVNINKILYDSRGVYNKQIFYNYKAKYKKKNFTIEQR